jgi:hypothetical protein
MSGTVCPLLPRPSIRARHLRDRLLRKHPEYAPSDRRPAACVIRLCAPMIIEDALRSWQMGHTYSCARGSRLDICDWEYHADRRA